MPSIIPLMGSRKLLAAVLAVSCAIVTSSVRAEFVKLGPLSFASTDLKTTVIISKGNPPSAGIFVAISNERTSIQEFDPSKLTSKNSRTFFIGYDPKSNGYNKLVLPNGSQFSVQGSLTVAVDKTRIAIDGSYCSIVTEGGSQPSILGLVGLELVLKLSGDIAVALTEANKFLTQRYKELIVSYTINDQGQLSLNGKPFDGSRLGVTITVDNPCMEASALIIGIAESRRIQESQDKAKELREIKHDSKRSRSIADYLALNVLTDSVIALDFESGEFGIIREQRELGNQVCEFAPAKLK